MANARACDGPTCDHVGPANPEGWLTVTVSPVYGEAFPDSDIAGTYDFAEPQCFESWLAQYVPKPEPEKPKRKGGRSR
jgi:hypothetical protein